MLYMPEAFYFAISTKRGVDISFSHVCIFSSSVYIRRILNIKKCTPVSIEEYFTEGGFNVAGESLADNYLMRSPQERQSIIYRNYPYMEGIISGYRSSLIYSIIEQKNYNRQHAKGDLGIRVATSSISDPVGNEVVNETGITKLVDAGVATEFLLEDVDDKEEISYRVRNLHQMTVDYRVFKNVVDQLQGQDAELFLLYIKKEATCVEIAEHIDVSSDAVKAKVQRMRRFVFDQMNTHFRDREDA